jgi:rhodanese-related sulfurtransferase
MSMGWAFAVVLGVVLFGAGFMRYRMGPPGLEMSAGQLLERLGSSDCVVLDVRSAREYRSGHIPGALHIPHSKVAGHLDELRAHEDCDIVIYCESGVRARIAQNTLAKAGFRDVYHLVGDMAGWRRDSRAVETVAVP